MDLEKQTTMINDSIKLFKQLIKFTKIVSFTIIDHINGIIIKWKLKNEDTHVDELTDAEYTELTYIDLDTTYNGDDIVINNLKVDETPF